MNKTIYTGADKVFTFRIRKGKKKWREKKANFLPISKIVLC